MLALGREQEMKDLFLVDKPIDRATNYIYFIISCTIVLVHLFTYNCSIQILFSN